MLLADERRESVSVIIPTHRDRSFIAEAIESARSQLREGDEILVCANGCDAPYLGLLASMATDVVRVIEMPAAGLVAARNLGIERARGTYVVLLDDDDAMFPGAIEGLRLIMSRDPAISAVTGQVTIQGPDGSMEERTGYPEEGKELRVQHLLHGPPTPSFGSAMFRRSALLQVGPLDAATAPADDWDLWLRLAVYGGVRAVGLRTLRYRLHATNASHNALLMSSRAFAVFDKHKAHLEGPGQHALRSASFRTVRSYYRGKLRDQAVRAVRRADVGDAVRAFAMLTRFAVAHAPLRLKAALGEQPRAARR